ncbi:beta-ketoacyl-[acyl-carrier-protein] synthase family protein [Escherichia coli]|uniref:beta-ketoacyl-[acyl-carrier-protein] synthase family protein n=1 Tax=Escherichia coli TaxID=562 RepID=UPI00165086FC|nr:beta-ketoacyl-[acyl-carrier-protein] synthase family protein [Escherichia coli]MBC6578105.1 beta-ketoacyl-[acyl-carrier-protein] synthase family protein [Escherichia coli]
MTDSKKNRVVITGVGAITPLGITAENNWQAIINNKIGYKYIDNSDWNVSVSFLGYIDNNLDMSFLPPSIYRRLPRYAQLIMCATNNALLQAFEQGNPFPFYNPLDCGVILGSGWGGIDQTYEEANIYSKSRFASPFTCFMSMNSIATAACSQFWGLKGYQNTVSAACATGAIAIGDAYELIRNGRMKMMIAGAGESFKTNFSIWSVDVLGALSKEKNDISKASCPFSAERSGFVPSEGAAILILEELDSARKRGAAILGEITGYGNFSDAHDIIAPSLDGFSRIAAIECAMKRASISPSSIDYINAHGTSTYLNDRIETLVYKKVFGDYVYNIPISSTKGHTGHLIAAAGAFETILCLFSIRDNIIPATLNLNVKDRECDLDFVANKPREHAVDRALSVSFGFGGSNAALAIERFR